MERNVTAHHGGHLEALLNGCPDAILAINAGGIIIFANKEACKLTERGMNELIGESIVEVYENKEAAREANRKIYESGGTIHEFETKTKTKSGKLIPVRVSASHLYDSSGKYIGGVGYFARYRPWSSAEAETKARLDQLENQLEGLLIVTTPIFEVCTGLSMVVVAGAINTGRFKDIGDTILDHIEKMKTQVILIDFSTAVVDTEEVAEQFAKLVRTVRLLGADCIAVGMPASFARAMEPLLEELGSLKTFNRMNVAFEEALKIIGKQIAKQD
ncbi:MAG: PAS domain-containing protein [Dehalococcoidales bacterium]|nr:PAS domain-containing protein [Dehalococcoidales bacterium]